ncbi:MAG TPA: hypothetical protein VEV85_01995 [Bryobacteraceae bacterium]|nr:hypothetical protein [Bryobacteraceae bacterium]
MPPQFVSAAYLTTLLATPVENLTVAQLRDLTDALERVSGGEARTGVVGTLLR